MSLYFKIASELDEKGFKDAAKQVRDLDKGAKDNAKSTAAWKDQTQKLQGIYSALVGLGIVTFYKSLVDEAVKLERSEFLLGQRVENTGLAWEKVKNQVIEYNRVMSDMTGVGYPEVNDALSRLIDSTNDVGKAQEYLSATLGLARAQGISYSTAAEQVGRATLGVTEFTKTLAERIGIAGEKSRDVAYVLKTFKERFGDLAAEEDTTAKKFETFREELSDWKADIGAKLIPGVLMIMNVLKKVGQAITALVELWATGWATMAQAAISSNRVIMSAITGNWAGVKEAYREGHASLAALMDENATAAKEFWNVLSGKEEVQKELPERIAEVDRTSKELTAVFRKMNAELLAEQQMSESKRLEYLLVALDAEKEIRRKQIADQMTAEKMSAEQITAMQIESDKALTAEQIKLTEQVAKKRFEVYFQMGNLIGAAAGKAAAGEADAWKKTSIQVIDIIAQRAQAAVMANAIQGASEEVAKKGVVGLFTGSKVIAWGVAQSAAIGAIAEAAKAKIGATGAAPAGGAATPTVAGTPAAAAPAEAAEEKQSVKVVVMGDYYGEQEFANRMAEKISSVVENNDVRLVASQVQGE